MNEPQNDNLSFDEVVEDVNRHYLDKTELIDRILKDPSQVILFNRPRGFGKSLNMSMLDCYFNLEYRGNGWFDGLRISDLRRGDCLKNTVPVIHLSLRDIRSDGYSAFIDSFSSIISSEFKRFEYLESDGTSDPVLLRMFRNLKEGRGDDTELTFSLLTLSEMLHDRHGRSVMILLDEYDRATEDACGGDLCEKETEFLEGFLSATFKGNRFLWKGILMGVLPILRGSIFSGMNNVTVEDIASSNYSDMFGFAREEIEGFLDGR